MDTPSSGMLPQVGLAEELLQDIAQKVQLSPSMHAAAVGHYEALCSYVDRDGSPLHGLVTRSYPGGSFATGTVVASPSRGEQHDVDVVIELSISPDADPETVLATLHQAISGDPGSRYRSKVKQNSRCVTVEYEDGTRVDLMPIARLQNSPERAGNLFHFRSLESYHKPVNPWGFAQHFNDAVSIDPAFVKQMRQRRFLAEGIIEKAETDPLPDQVAIEEKSARVVALQLLKRSRDIDYLNRNGRKPPSVVLSALSLNLGAAQPSLLLELIRVAGYVRDVFANADEVVRVTNPAYAPDVFSDRWPGGLEAQRLYAADLTRLVTRLERMRDNDLSLDELRDALREIFGESPAQYAVESYLKSRQNEIKSGGFAVGPRGRVLTGAAGASAVAGGSATAARATTFYGGDLDDE